LKKRRSMVDHRTQRTAQGGRDIKKRGLGNPQIYGRIRKANKVVRKWEVVQEKGNYLGKFLNRTGSRKK